MCSTSEPKCMKLTNDGKLAIMDNFHWNFEFDWLLSDVTTVVIIGGKVTIDSKFYTMEPWEGGRKKVKGCKVQFSVPFIHLLIFASKRVCGVAVLSNDLLWAAHVYGIGVGVSPYKSIWCPIVGKISAIYRGMMLQNVGEKAVMNIAWYVT